MKVFVVVSLVVFSCLVIVVECRPKKAAAEVAGGGEKEGRNKARWGLNPALQRTTLPLKAAARITQFGKGDRSFGEQTWDYFQRQNALYERNEKRKKKAARQRQLRTGSFYPRGSIGPPGPRGPVGPRGPKGANITKEEMVEEVRLALNEMLHKNLLVGADPRCTALCVSNLAGNATGPVAQVPLFENHQEVLVPKVLSSFIWELREYTKVPKHSRMELDMFKQSSRPGAYGREIGESKADTGRFVAPRTGFYQFNVRMHLHLPVVEGNKQVQGDQLFSVGLCVDGACGSKMLLETVSGFGPGERMTVTVNGIFYLKVNEYVSVVIDNSSKHDFDVFDGSQFSGYLMGV